MFEYHCLLAAAAAATEAMDVTMFVLFIFDDTDDNTDRSPFVDPSSQQGDNVLLLRLLHACPDSTKKTIKLYFGYFINDYYKCCVILFYLKVL